MSPGITDEAVLLESRISASVLITADKDFGELVFRQGARIVWRICSAEPGNIRIRRDVHI
jgi:predicted nuclease of predicted toxin-antitoxin system